MFSSCDISIESSWKTIQIYQLSDHLTSHLTVNSRKWPKNCYFCWLFYWGGHVHIGWARKLNFGMDNGLHLYFHDTKQFLKGAHSGPLPIKGRVTTRKSTKKEIGSCDISNESSWKTLFNYANWMLIWHLICPSAAENYLKIAFLIIVLLRGASNTVWQRKLNFGIEGGALWTPLRGEGNHPGINKKIGSCDIANESS